MPVDPNKRIIFAFELCLQKVADHYGCEVDHLSMELTQIFRDFGLSVYGTAFEDGKRWAHEQPTVPVPKPPVGAFTSTLPPPAAPWDGVPTVRPVKR